MSEIQSAFTECLAWWGLTFFLGIAFREFSRDEVGRWLGRISVATSCFVLISFCEFAIHQCNVQYQVIVSRNSEGVIHEEKPFESDAEIFVPGGGFRTPSGLVVTYTVAEKSDAGGSDTTVPRTSGGSQWSLRRGGQGKGGIRSRDPERDRAAGVVRAVPFTQPGLNEWK